MTQSVMQFIRDFVLAPALLTSAIVSTLGAFGMLLAFRKEGIRPGGPVVWTAVAYLVAFLATTLLLVGTLALEVRLDVSWPRPLGWFAIGVVWAALVAVRVDACWRDRLIRGVALGVAVGLSAWAVDVYVVSALLFVG